jgi:hypothetical protein
METILWNRNGVLKVENMQQVTTIMSEVYSETLENLRRVGQLEQKTWNVDIRCSAPP